MTPKEAITKAMRDRMIGDYGHDLPDDHFWIEADEILDALKEAGFVVLSVSDPLAVAQLREAKALGRAS